MFLCESCGHALGLHNPCNATVGKKARLCGCPQFEPADTAARVATLTDHPSNPAAALAALAQVQGGKL